MQSKTYSQRINVKEHKHWIRQISIVELTVSPTEKGSVESRYRVAEFLSHTYPSGHIDCCVLAQDVCNFIIAVRELLQMKSAGKSAYEHDTRLRRCNSNMLETRGPTSAQAFTASSCP